ncbi:hypothetical protein ACR3S7_000533 [Campylobacter lari]
MNSSLERLNTKENFNYSNTQRIKNIFLSLATISFLATCANSSVIISDPSSSGSIEISKARKTRAIDDCAVNNGCTIIESNSNSVTISNAQTAIIKEGIAVGDGNGYVGVNINDVKDGKVNLINNGTIITPWDTAGVAGIVSNNSNIGSIVNNGMFIKGVWAGSDIIADKSTIDNITNNTTMQSWGDNIRLNRGTKVASIINNGTMNASWSNWYSGENIVLLGNDEVANIINYGTMQAIGNANIVLRKNTKVDTFENYGLMKGSESGIEVESSNMNTLINSETILGINDTGISFNNAIGGTLTNKGTIIGNNKGISLNTNTTIDTFENKNFIQGNQYGIRLENQSTLTNLNNTGTIQGKQAGISFDSAIGGTLTNAGNIIGDINGINIDSASKVDSIILTSSNALIAGVNAGINNEGTIGKDDTSNAITLKQGIITALQNNRQINTADNALINNGTIQGNISLTNNAKIIGTLKNTKTITGSIELNSNSQINTISNEGTINKDIKLNQSTIANINNAGTITNGINLSNKSAIGDITNSGNVNSITLANSGITNITNSGSINNTISLNASSIKNFTNANNGTMHNLTLDNSGIENITNNNQADSITLANNSFITSLKNTKTITGSIELNSNSQINTISNEGTINKDIKLNQSTIANINNAGTITNGINLSNKSAIGDIINNSTIGKEATLYSMSNDQVYGIKNHGNIGQVNNNAVIFNGIYNANSITSLLNNGNIYSGIKNTGTIESLVNTKKAIIHDDIENDGTMKLTNYGTIGGITNSNSFTLINGYVQGSGKHAKYISGVLNKNKNGYHIENNGKGVFSINSWYFDAPEFLNKEDRLKNSVVLGGNNLGGIKVDEVYINTANLDTKKIYDSNTFFIDEKGNSIGNNTNDDKGIDAKNIHSLTDIYYFMNVPSEKGKYRVSVDINELSGKTLAKSMVYSARLRSINVSNLLRNAAGLNLQSDLSKNNRKYLDSNTTYYFLNPYYNHSSAKIGKSVGQLRMDTAGLIGGSFKQLPKDYGVIGFYLGHEDSSKKQNTQRLNFDDKTYYGGLTYYNVLKRKGLDEYYFSAYSKFDYTKTNIEKSYKNNPASSKANTLVYGYGAEAKIGANYYNAIDVARVSPEIGLSYYGMSSKNFSLNHLGGTKEHYLAGQFNFVDASAALKWYKPWTDKFKSNITIGSIVNLYTDARGKLKLDENTLTADVITSKYYGFGQFGLSYALNKHSDISLNYAGVFTFDNTTSHTMFLKLGLWW